MKVFIWLLSLMIGGSTALMCNEATCDASKLDVLSQRNYMLTESELQELCPQILDTYNCYFKYYKDCYGREVEELIQSGDELQLILIYSIYNGRNLAIQLCDENSTLHNDYLENVECFRRLVNDEDRNVAFVCSEKADEYAEAFLRKFRDIKEGDLNSEELSCLEQVYLLACVAEQLEITCGEVAKRTFLAIFEKANNVMNIQCRVENIRSLKRPFLEYLELDEQKSEFYWQIFEQYGRL